MLGQRWTTASTVGVGPLAGDQPPVPPQDRARLHQEERPAPTRERSAQHRQQRTVGGAELGLLDLSTKHVELVAEHGDLDVLGVLASQAPEQSACHEVEEGKSHRRIIA
jgi:hypothetical protein